MQEFDSKLFAQVGAEMSRQVAKWGIQNHASYTPDGVIGMECVINADLARAMCDLKARMGNLSWMDIFMEEAHEAADEALAGNLVNLRTELIQVMAVAGSWIQSIDRNGK